MLNITHHQGNANQNHNEVLASHLLEWQLPKSQEMKSVTEDVEKMEQLCTLVGI